MARSPILLIDDNLKNLQLLERTLEWGGFFNVKGCGNAKDGLAALDTFRPHLIVLDLMMPDMDGYEFLEVVRGMRTRATVNLPILVFTADLNREAKIRALGLGASDFLTKPGDAIEIKIRVHNFLRARAMQEEILAKNDLLEAKVAQRTGLLAKARSESIDLLSTVCEFRVDPAGEHAARVGGLSAQIAAQLGWETAEVDAIRLVAPIHDIGNAAIPDRILLKPGPLTPEEFAEMKTHVEIGGRMLEGKTSPFLQQAREIVVSHHERWDGAGYGQGLAGEDIPLCARIVAVADAFDAMTHDRPHRAAISPADARAELDACAGTQFDPAVVKAMQSVLT